MEFEDNSGKPPSERDMGDALRAVTQCMVGPAFMQLPPELAVNMPNIRRCLLELMKRKP